MNLRAYFEILRPFNCFMAAFAANIGIIIGGIKDPVISACIFLAVFMITGAGNTINDYYDRAIDAVNRPKRPIPSKKVTPEGAWKYSLVLFLAGSALAATINLICLLFASFNSILLFFYARNLKSTPFFGNLCVSFLTGSTFIFGGGAAGLEGLAANWVPFLLSFLASMSREIAKDIEDIEGDRLGNARTLPILAGERFAARLAAAFAILAVILGFFAPFGKIYLAIVIMADVFLLLSVKKILEGNAAGSQKALKKGFALALLAFLAGALFH